MASKISLALIPGCLVIVKPFALIEVTSGQEYENWIGVIIKKAGIKLYDSENTWEILIDTGKIVNLPESWIIDTFY